MRFWIGFLTLVLTLTAGCSSSPSGEDTPPAQPAETSETEPGETQAPANLDEPEPERDAAVQETPPDGALPAEPKVVPPKKDAPAAKTVARKSDTRKPAAGPHPGLKDPSQANEEAPERFKVKFETTRGDFVVEVYRDWAPLGADRFYNLVRIGYFQDIAFYRVIDGFIVQFGFSGDPEINRAWRDTNIKDDPPQQSNKRGTITFATGGPNTRTTQLFINYVDNPRLDSMGFTPFGKVIEGMDVVDSLYSAYGEGAPYGPGPSQRLIATQGNDYLRAKYPKLDYIKRARLID